MNLTRFLAPYDPPRTSLVECLAYWAAQQPQQAAFYYTEGEYDEGAEDAQLSYHQLLIRARAIAARLQQLELAGERVLLMFPPDRALEFVAAYFGCLHAGAVAVPAFPPRRNRNTARIHAIANDAGARAALVSADVRARLEQSEDALLRDLTCVVGAELDDALSDEYQEHRPAGDALAMLQYTSGSTGTPKGVMLTHGNMMHNVALITHSFEPSREGVGMTWLPTYHDMGLVGGVLKPMFYGRPNVLMSPMTFLSRPVRWLRAVSKYQVTISGGPNFAYELCADKISDDELEGIDLSSWDVAFNGAEPIRWDSLKRFADRFAACGFQRSAFYPCYGMAETTLIVTGGRKAAEPVVRPFDRQALDQRIVREAPPAPAGETPAPAGETPAPAGETGHAELQVRELVGCGRVLPDERVVIVEPDKCVSLPEDQVGEIWVQSPSVALGYWNHAEATEAAFGARLADRPELGTFLRTGDLGFFHEGELFVTGRLKDLIIVRGVNRYPQDIEQTVEHASPRLNPQAAAAFAVEVQGRERLVIVSEVERKRSEHWDEVIQAIRGQVVAEHDLPPDAVVLVRFGSVPTTSSGKIQRHACRDQFLEGELKVVAQWTAWQDDQEPAAESGSASDAAAHGATLAAAAAAPMSGRLLPSEQPAGDTGPKEVDPQVAQVVFEQVRLVAQERARSLTLETNIALDLGLDSLERLQIANQLEEIYGGRFPQEVLGEIETCREVAVAIAEHLGTRPRTGTAVVGRRETAAVAGDAERSGQSAAAVPATPKADAPQPPADAPAALRVDPQFMRFDSYPQYQALQEFLARVERAGLEQPYFADRAPSPARPAERSAATSPLAGADSPRTASAENANFATANYLGMSGDPLVTAEAIAAMERFGASASASRLVSGEKTVHVALERCLADFLGAEEALAMVADHSTNESVIGSLLGPGDLVLYDEAVNHGTRQGAILAGARRRAFPHNDPAAADQILRECRGQFRRVLLAVDGLYDVAGDLPDLPAMIAVKNRHKVWLMVDESHSLGTLGPHGRGICEHFDLDSRHIDLVTGTLSLALGSSGAFVAGCRELIEWLKYSTPTFVYSTGLSPSCAAAALTALKLLEEEPERVERLQAAARQLHALGQQLRLPIPAAPLAVMPLKLGDSLLTLQVAQRLQQQGILVQPLVYPVVDESDAELRFFVNQRHTHAQLQRAMELTAAALDQFAPQLRAASTPTGSRPAAASQQSAN